MTVRQRYANIKKNRDYQLWSTKTIQCICYMTVWLSHSNICKKHTFGLFHCILCLPIARPRFSYSHIHTCRQQTYKSGMWDSIFPY